MAKFPRQPQVRAPKTWMMASLWLSGEGDSPLASRRAEDQLCPSAAMPSAIDSICGKPKSTTALRVTSMILRNAAMPAFKKICLSQRLYR